MEHKEAGMADFSLRVLAGLGHKQLYYLYLMGSEEYFVGLCDIIVFYFHIHLTMYTKR